MPRCLSMAPLQGNIYKCDYPSCTVLFHMEATEGSYECGQCRSRYCTMHDGNPLFFDQDDEEPGHEYEHWDEDLDEEEQKIPKGCITCTTHPKYIEKRVFREDEVMKYALKKAKLKDYNEAVKFLKMELSVKEKEKEKEKEEHEKDNHILDKVDNMLNILRDQYIHDTKKRYVGKADNEGNIIPT